MSVDVLDIWSHLHDPDDLYMTEGQRLERCLESTSIAGLKTLTAAMRAIQECCKQSHTGSKMPGPLSGMLAEGSIPKLPVSIDASSDRMSPKMLPVTTVSNSFGIPQQLHCSIVDVPGKHTRA